MALAPAQQLPGKPILKKSSCPAGFGLVVRTNTGEWWAPNGYQVISGGKVVLPSPLFPANDIALGAKFTFGETYAVQAAQGILSDDGDPCDPLGGAFDPVACQEQVAGTTGGATSGTLTVGTFMGENCRPLAYARIALVQVINDASGQPHVGQVFAPGMPIPYSLWFRYQNVFYVAEGHRLAVAQVDSNGANYLVQSLRNPGDVIPDDWFQLASSSNTAPQAKLSNAVRAIEHQRAVQQSPARMTQMKRMMQANTTAGADDDAPASGTLGSPSRRTTMTTDPRNLPAHRRDPSYMPPTISPGTVAGWQQGALAGNLQNNYGVGAIRRMPKGNMGQESPLAPKVKATACPPGTTTLPNGQCGHTSPAALQKQCPDNSVQYGLKCFPLPSWPTKQAMMEGVILAYKSIDLIGAPALVFYLYNPSNASGGAPGAMVTTHAFVWSGGDWHPTKLDEHMLSTMSVVLGQVPAGKMLALVGSVVPNTVNALVTVPAVITAKRAVVNTGTSGVEGLGAHAQPTYLPRVGSGDKPLPPPPTPYGHKKPILNRRHGAPAPGARPTNKPIAPLGAGMAEFYRPRPGPVARVGAVAAAPRTKMTSYITVRGDTLRSIASQHGISAKTLAAMNPGVLMPFNTPMSGGFRINVPNRA